MGVARPEVRYRAQQKYYFRNREALRAKKKEYDRLHPRKKKLTERERVRKAFAQAIRRGRIIRPKHCSKCGTEGVIHGHHEDYSKPFDVQWLCTRCHGIAHRYSSRTSTEPTGE